MLETPRICPYCGNAYWSVTAHVVQNWKVDKHGNFEETLEDCVEVAHYPNDDDIWYCTRCGNEYTTKKVEPLKIKTLKEVQAEEEIGDVFTIEDFANDVAHLGFMSCDGHGRYHNGFRETDEYVEFLGDDEKEDAELILAHKDEYPYVIWFNK